MSTPGRTARTMPGTASANYERLEELRRQHREELKERLGQLRVALTPADAVEVNDIEALCDNSSSAGISAAIVEITSRTLQDIEGALDRLESGTYGRCSDCGAEIPAARLRAMPFAEDAGIARSWPTPTATCSPRDRPATRPIVIRVIADERTSRREARDGLPPLMSALTVYGMVTAASERARRGPHRPTTDASQSGGRSGCRHRPPSRGRRCRPSRS